MRDDARLQEKVSELKKTMEERFEFSGEINEENLTFFKAAREHQASQFTPERRNERDDSKAAAPDFSAQVNSVSIHEIMIFEVKFWKKGRRQDSKWT